MNRLPVLHILKVAINSIHRDIEFSEFNTSKFSEKTVYNTLRLLVKEKIFSKSRLGNEVTYRLDHDRLETINAAAARLL
jgi:Fe2+ or Zn2+ uptake regulation protein